MATVLLLKLCLVPSLIYLVTLIGRRWGPNAAGWFSALPIVAGPILLTMAIEQVGGLAAFGLSPQNSPAPITEVTLGRDPSCTLVIENSVVYDSMRPAAQQRSAFHVSRYLGKNRPG